MKTFKYVLLFIAFVFLYITNINNAFSAAETAEPDVCNNPSPPQDLVAPTAKPGDLTIVQVMPNPKGKDQGNEWIELKNNTTQDLNLLDFILVVNDKKYDLPDTTIAPGQKLHALSKDLKITLPNKATTLILQDSIGKEIDRLQYPEAKDDATFSHNQKIAMTTTKGTGNHLKLPTSGNDGSLLASAGATFLIRLWLKDRIS